MVFTCFLCKWSSDKYPRRSYHKFPDNDELKQKWLDIIGKSNVTIGKRTSLCCLHFEEDCFRYGLVNGRKILKNGSFPTLLLTKGGTEDQTGINSVKEIPEFPIEHNLLTSYPAKDEVKMNDVTLEVKVENNVMEISIKKCSVNESSRRSTPSPVVDVPPDQDEVKCLKENVLSSPSPVADVQPNQDEVLRLKEKVLRLKRLMKRLRNSNRAMRSQLKELNNRVCNCEAENKLMHVVEDEMNASFIENNVKIKREPLYEECVESSAKILPDICMDRIIKTEPTDDANPIREESEIDYNHPIKQEVVYPLSMDNREQNVECSIKKEAEGDPLTSQQSVTFYDVEITGFVSSCAQTASGDSEQTSAASLADCVGAARRYQCPQCSIQCGSNKDLTIHMSEHTKQDEGSGDKLYSCNTCSKKFTRTDTLANHMRTHTGLKACQAALSRAATFEIWVSNVCKTALCEAQ